MTRCVKMVVPQIPLKIFSRPICQNANKFGLHHYGTVGMLIILWKLWGSCDQKCVKMANWSSVWKNRINSFKNLLFQTHPSECYQIWVTTLGQGLDTLWRSCQSYVRKCVKIAVLANFLENRVNSFKNLPHQTHQSKFYHIWIPALGEGPGYRSSGPIFWGGYFVGSRENII